MDELTVCSRPRRYSRCERSGSGRGGGGYRRRNSDATLLIQWPRLCLCAKDGGFQRRLLLGTSLPATPRGHSVRLLRGRRSRRAVAPLRHPSQHHRRAPRAQVRPTRPFPERRLALIEHLEETLVLLLLLWREARARPVEEAVAQQRQERHAEHLSYQALARDVPAGEGHEQRRLVRRQRRRREGRWRRRRGGRERRRGWRGMRWRGWRALRRSWWCDGGRWREWRWEGRW